MANGKNQRSAREIRTHVLREILSVLDADAALYFSVSHIESKAVIADAQVAGDSDAERLVDCLVGRTDVAVERLQNPEALECRAFVEGDALPGAFGAVLKQFGVNDRIRMFVYDGRRFVGWIGALRFAPNRTRFSRADRRRLAPIAPAAAISILDADALARGSVPIAPGFVAMHPGGDVEQASIEGHAWLERPGFSLALQRRMSFLDPQLGSAAIAVELAECRIVPMTGVRSLLLVQLSEARSIETSAVRLSPTQREVASFAASGATVGEIASAMGRRPETVRSHLREAYTRLGVSNRVELSRALAA